MKILKCHSCNALVKVLEDCHCRCGIECCGEKMEEVIPNSTEASFEKHLPQYEKVGDKIKVVVPHVMEEDHYITMISYVHDDIEETITFAPNKKATVEFIYYPHSKLYSYCNQHGLWETDVE